MRPPKVPCRRAPASTACVRLRPAWHPDEGAGAILAAAEPTRPPGPMPTPLAWTQKVAQTNREKRDMRQTACTPAQRGRSQQSAPCAKPSSSERQRGGHVACGAPRRAWAEAIPENGSAAMTALHYPAGRGGTSAVRAPCDGVWFLQIRIYKVVRSMRHEVPMASTHRAQWITTLSYSVGTATRASRQQVQLLCCALPSFRRPRLRVEQSTLWPRTAVSTDPSESLFYWVQHLRIPPYVRMQRGISMQRYVRACGI